MNTKPGLNFQNSVYIDTFKFIFLPNSVEFFFLNCTWLVSLILEYRYKRMAPIIVVVLNYKSFQIKPLHLFPNIKIQFTKFTILLQIVCYF